ncbi:MAG TPA: class I SAM-dependent methyltransferase [Acidimicrobiales bacterium]|nr:class I SAM-dependent methyltransferase [Acidimicrobiales bacterium]
MTHEGQSEMPKGTPVDIASAIWDRHASWWRETFSDGADIEYAEEIVPLVIEVFAERRRVLDLGCGEGQIARALHAANGAIEVIGLDSSCEQLLNARSYSSPEIAFVQGAAEQVPFADRSFDGVVCCLAIEHCEDVDRVLEEVTRVLGPGGAFFLLINHPLYQGTGSGFVDDQILGEHYWRVGPYLEERVAFEEVDNGVTLPFAHRPLSRYINPLSRRDLVLIEMFEPPPLPAFLAGSVDPGLESAIPRLLALYFEHRPRPTI